MIKSVTIINDLGDSVEMKLGEVEPYSGLFITEIDGLGPVKADINMTPLATQDGSKYNSARANGRNIVLKMMYISNGLIEDVRESTYTFFPLKRKVTVHIETDKRSVECYGYVESNEPDIFSERSAAVISIVCETPWFYDVSPSGIQLLNFSDINDMFEFPYSNESLSENLTIFSELEERGEKTLFFKGEAETGIIMSIYAYGPFTYPIVYYNVTHEFFKIDTSQVEQVVGSAIRSGDEIRISTVENDKWAYLIRNGVFYNILNSVDIDSTWFKMRPGYNTFSYTSATGNLDVTFQIRTQIIYQGV